MKTKCKRCGQTILLDIDLDGLELHELRSVTIPCPQCSLFLRVYIRNEFTMFVELWFEQSQAEVLWR